DFDDARCGVEALVGIAVISKRLKQERLGGIAANRVFERQQVERAGLRGRTKWKPAGVRENFTDEDGVIRRVEFRWLHGSRCGLTRSGTGAVDHLAPELRKVFLHRV